MRIYDFRLVGMRCFEDTGDVVLGQGCNIFVGKNNSGKSSALKAILSLQGFPFDQLDVRPGHQQSSFITAYIGDIISSDQFHVARPSSQSSMRVGITYGGNSFEQHYHGTYFANVGVGQPVFIQGRPHHVVVPFLAKRKSAQFSHDVSTGPQAQLSGTLAPLYSRIDLLATYGHPDHDQFLEAVQEIVGLPITMKASSGGKEAGFYFDRDTFVTLDRMGDGVSEMVALIVELCAERNKIFVLEEPETNLHPRGLKALLAMIRSASEFNQFLIATHSNVVVRELAGEDSNKVFRVFRDGDTPTSPSKIEEVERTPEAHMSLLRELGYEFADINLYEGWLFLEESSAETIIRDILIPNFVPDLRGRLRTYAAGGVDNLEPSVSEFQRLVTFVHLQPVYKGRLWIRADGDDAGQNAVSKLRGAFSYLDDASLATFKKMQFEHYYPAHFEELVSSALAITDKQAKRKRKAELLQEVLAWTKNNLDEALAAWQISAKEQIELLQSIQVTLSNID